MPNGNVDSIAKWNNTLWDIPNDSNRGRSFSICRQDFIINNPRYENYNVIIIADGSRVEDHSKENFEIKQKKGHINVVINHYKNLNENTKILSLYMDADAPIKEQSRLFARYIETFFSSNVNKISIIGISKCALLNMYVPRFISEESVISKLNIVNIAGPYKGALLASPKFLEEKLLNVFGNTIIGKKITNSMMGIVYSISSNSHMDYDIAKPGGVPNEAINLYDETFIKDLFSNDNINSLKKCESFTNYATSISKTSIKNSIRNMDYAGVGLLILSKILYDNESDGFIPTEDQIVFEDTKHLETSHSILTNNKAIEIILNDLDKNNYNKSRLIK